VKDDKLYLIHISECIERIESYTQEGREAFLQSRMTQDAVIRNFEVIGEAAKQISPSFREAHPEITWRRLVAFRDVLIHAYFKIDFQEVWRVVVEDMPVVKQQVQELLASLP